jgi:predicted PurR-regulated permease PerM
VGAWGKYRWAAAFGVVAAALLLIFWLQNVLLLTLLAIILGILFRKLANFGVRFLRLPYRFGVIVAVLVFLGAVVGTLSLIAIPLLQQGTGFVKTLPEKVSRVDHRFQELKGDFPWLQQILPSLQPAQETQTQSESARVAKKALLTASTLLEGGSAALTTMFLGIFLAWDPERWRRGVAHLIPLGTFEQRMELFGKIAKSLEGYLLVYGIYMLAMGVLWGLGLWLAGIDYWLVFGVLGGVVEIVPYLGPVIAFIPPLLVALGTSSSKALAVSAVYVVLHVIEGYLLVPWLMHKQEHLPPPLVILSILACGTLFGLMGVLLAVPLATIGYVICNELVYKKHLSA